MTSEDWQADRQAVFERDSFTCQRCGSASVAAGSEGLRIHAVGSVPLEDTVPPSVLVTVCDSCYASLHDQPEIESVTPEILFDLIRSLTRAQGDAIAIAASFASMATSIPAAIEANEDPEYPTHRREFLLVLDLVDAKLEHLALVDRSSLESDVVAALEDFSTIAEQSQGELRAVVELVQSTVIGLGRCHVCFEHTAETSRCSHCGTAVPELTEWRTEEGSTDFQGLYMAINDLLGGTSDTTEQLTDRTTVLAELLVEQD